MGVGIWCFGCYLLLVSQNKIQAVFASRILQFGSIPIPILQLHFAYLFIDISKKRRGLLYAGYVLTFILLISDLFTPFFIRDVSPNLYFLFFPVAGPLYHIFTIIYFGVSFYWIYLLTKSIPSLSPLKRNQAKYVAIASVIGIIGGGSTFFLIYNIPFPPFPALLVALYPLIISYAILKYRLMDIRLVITRVSIFVAVYTFVLGIPFVLAFWLKPWLSAVVGFYWWMLPLGMMGLFATIGPFVYIYLDKKTEERLFKRQRRYQNTLKQASLGMSRIRDLDKLLKLVVHIVSRSVRINYAGIYLEDKENNIYNLKASRGELNKPALSLSPDNLMVKQLIAGKETLFLDEIKSRMMDAPDLESLKLEMAALGATVVVPSLIEGRLLGFMVLGDKCSGEIYTKDDMEVFTVLANQAALAIENARFFAESKEMQEQISQAEKMATIGTMADGLSHQINNRFHALSLISGDVLDSISLADTANYNDEQKELLGEIKYGLERIQDNVIQGGEVVKGMLKYTRKGDAGFGQVSLDEIIDATLDMVKYKIKLSEIDIIRDYPKDIPKVKGNLTQLQEVFFNLIDNAYDAAMERKQAFKEPGYRARIKITTEYNNNGVLKIDLEDNGIGVKEEDYKKLFTPFFTTKVSSRKPGGGGLASDSQSRKGTGLGLYVIKKIVADNHKGKINVLSRYRQGTRFKLELPVAWAIG